MKPTIQLLNVLSVCALLSVSACNNSSNKTSSTADTITTRIDTAVQEVKQAAQNAASDVRDAMVSNPDSSFVVKAALANNEELALLQAGTDNGGKEVKMHAKMMMTDHKKLGAKVKAYAAGKNYMLPDGDDGKSQDDLSSLNQNNKGADWDKAWLSMMIDKHDGAISMFEKGQNDVKDPDLKAIITDALPALHKHHDMVKTAYDNMK